MSAYQFCRTDDIPLLVEAQRRCWQPHFPDAPEPTVEAFKRQIRELQVWCSSCMVASDGDETIGVLIGAKRPAATLIHRIAVHPDHLRQGHARHLLTSLSSKLAILGPSRIVAEVPEQMTATKALFESCGYQPETVLTDYTLALEGRMSGSSGSPPADTFLVPLNVEDVQANDLFAGGPEPCWQRGKESILAHAEAIRGIAMASTDAIAAFGLYRSLPDGSSEVVALRAVVNEEDAAEFLGCVLDSLARKWRGNVTFPKVHADEVSAEWLLSSGFRPGPTYVRYVAAARSA